MGTVKTTTIEDEMEESYINYAMSVIRGRAIPDVRDGLKPVQRRILYGLHDLGLTSDKAHKKSARIVGEVMGKYHPHGDSAVYDTMVNMAQDFSFRYPLVDGQGNFGSIDGDSAAAMRYTEARLSAISETFLDELDEDTVDFQSNFDDSLEEPTILPAKVPGLLLNGAWGISVGMTTKVPPHNLREVIDGLTHLIDNPGTTLEGLMEHIKGPDFPTGAIILGREGIKEAYRTGKGKIRMRAKTELEGNQIVITEIPFQVKKSTIIERVADKVKNGKIEGISDVRDESDREGLRIVITLKRGAEPQVILNRLFKYTPLERTFGANFLVIIDGNPRRLSLKETLNSFIDFRRQVVRRRTEYRLENAESRAHILEGLQTAVINSEKILQLIRDASDRSEAESKLIDQFQFTEEQAQAILKMQLGRLTSLEREKITTELQEKQEKIEEYNTLLSSSTALDEIIKDELAELRDNFGDERRSMITEKHDQVDTTQLIPDHSLLIEATENNRINAPKKENFSTQRRAGKGIISITLDEEDRLRTTHSANARDDLLLFSSHEQAYGLEAYKLPMMRRDTKGKPIGQFVEWGDDEQLQAMANISDQPLDETYLLLATQGGMVSKNSLQDFSSAHTSGIQAINTNSGDHICSGVFTYGEGDVIMATRSGKAIRFDQEELRTTQRPSKGVIGIDLRPSDQLIDIQTFEYDKPAYEKKVLFVTEQGNGKKVPLEEFSIQGRSGMGNLGIKCKEEDGVVAMRIVEDNTEIMISSEDGKTIRLNVDEISEFRRYARGVCLMQLDQNDRIASVAVI